MHRIEVRPVSQTVPREWQPGRTLLRLQTDRIPSREAADKILAEEQQINARLRLGLWEARVVFEAPPEDQAVKVDWSLKEIKKIDALCSVCQDPTFPVKTGKTRHKHCSIPPSQIKLPPHLRKQEQQA